MGYMSGSQTRGEEKGAKQVLNPFLQGFGELSQRLKEAIKYYDHLMSCL